jgi:hypothetical protein
MKMETSKLHLVDNVVEIAVAELRTWCAMVAGKRVTRLPIVLAIKTTKVQLTVVVVVVVVVAVVVMVWVGAVDEMVLLTLTLEARPKDSIVATSISVH